VDVELLMHCAKGLPDATFVLVGPVKRHRVKVAPLEDLSNVHLLPPCPHSEVPAIVAALDVCLIPYRMTAYTKGLSPIKLYEYLALGKPVVATDLPYLQREAAHIHIARTAQDFLTALREVLAHPPTTEDRARWRAAAEAHSWQDQVDEIERLLDRLLQGTASTVRPA
jgi:glycosyltransferase involved in cell wall biosynthesis